MNALKIINDIKNDRQLVNGRELHKFLEVETPYTIWFQRMCDYGFEENTDFITKMLESTGGRPKTENHISIDMAKELCMLQRTEKGKIARKYFLEVEKAWNSPEKIMARALQLSQMKIEEQTQLIEEMAPKAKYFDDLVDRKLCTNIRDTAKLLNVKEKAFTRFLIENGYVYRDKRNVIKPYSKHVDVLFVLKETKSKHNNWAGPQTLITPKGKETFNLLLNNLYEYE